MRTLRQTTNNTSQSILILAVFTIAFSINSRAQELKMGLAITPNASWMVPIDTIHNAEGINANMGIEFIADFMLNEKLAFSTGIHIFNTKGTINYLDPIDVNQNSADFINTVTRDYDLKYVEIPLAIKGRTKEIGYTTLYGQFGLGLGLNIGADATDQRQKVYQYESNSWVEFEDNYLLPSSPAIQNDIKLSRLSYILGIGVEQSIGDTYSLIVGANYNAGLINIHKGSEQADIDESGNLSIVDLKGNDRTIELVIGLIF